MLTETQQLVLHAVRGYDGIARYATLAYKLNMEIRELRRILEEVATADGTPVSIEFGTSCVFVRERAA